MTNQFYERLTRKYPQNYLLKNPLIGSLIMAVFCFGFMALYQPLNTHPAAALSYEVTMAIYSFTAAMAAMVSMKVIKGIKYFSHKKEWSILKELMAITLVLFGTGVAIYFIAFFIEPPISRWDAATFFDSCKYAFLIGILPFAFFSVINYRHLITPPVEPYDISATQNPTNTSETLIQISSKLKKENLSFYPSQFLFALSDGNYVIFHLILNNEIKKKTIRNSISNIEQQLSEIPYFIRTHRAFMVNMKKVTHKQRNTSGYRLKLTKTDTEVPVSRNNIQAFDTLFTQFHS
ncbi:LytTR family transcriptional regulator [Marinilabiliaceae bacterium JC017]|nr:LytTR family transcriptional regulator [Marinilabiliaceae bacterium JC017]